MLIPQQAQNADLKLNCGLCTESIDIFFLMAELTSVAMYISYKIAKKKLGLVSPTLGMGAS